MNAMKENNLRTLAMLKYQAERYQMRGNGAMCQQLNAQIRSILGGMNTNSTKI